MTTLHAEREVITGLLDRAADALRSKFRTALRFETKDAAGRDAVTEADLASERILVAGLHESFPEDAILSEESAAPTASAARTWIVDPLDGTNNFRQGIPLFCISAALWQDARPVLGAIRSVLDDELFLAERGQGASLANQPTRVGPAADIASIRASCDSGVSDEQRARAGRAFARLAPRVRGIRVIGSAALSLAYVACGRFDAYWNAAMLHPWDVAAGVLLVSEAGGRVSRVDGSEVGLEPGTVVASNGRVHDDLLAAIQESRS